MGQATARRRLIRLGTTVPTGPRPVFVEETLLFPKAEHDALMQLCEEYNDACRGEGKPLVSFSAFLRGGIIPHGVAVFKAARAEYIRSKRLILLPGEAAVVPAARPDTAPGR